jgi:hypothetical protein
MTIAKHEMHQTLLADLAQVKQFLDTVKWPQGEYIDDIVQDVHR